MNAIKFCVMSAGLLAVMIISASLFFAIAQLGFMIETEWARGLFGLVAIPTVLFATFAGLVCGVPFLSGFSRRVQSWL